MFLFKRNQELLDKIAQYFKMSDLLMDDFKSAITKHLDDLQRLEMEMKKTKRLESNADAKVHDIEEFLYHKSLLPDFREDVLKLFEKFDDIIDTAENIIQYIYVHKMTYPKFIKESIIKMIEASHECYQLVKLLVNDLFNKRDNVKQLVIRIGDYESICDDIQAEIVDKIYSTDDIDKCDRILFEECIRLIAMLTDSCENVADVVRIINIKSVV